MDGLDSMDSLISEQKAMVTKIIPYYGRWPDYIRLYFNSLAPNSEFLRVVFITDLAPIPEL